MRVAWSYLDSVGEEVNGVQYAAPLWVQKAGAKGQVVSMWDTESWIPVWDDPVFREKLGNFYAAFAAKYDGKPWLR